MRKKRLYLTGYEIDAEPVFGKPKMNFGQIYPMTITQAKRDLKEFSDVGAVIYKLVKVDPKKI